MIIKTTNHQIQDLRKQLSIANSKLAQEKEEHKSCGDRLANLRMELSIRDALIKKQRDENTFLQKALLRAIENQDVTVEDLREQIEELESKLDDAQAENNDLQDELDTALPRRRDPYYENGVRRSDFEGGSCYA